MHHQRTPGPPRVASARVRARRSVPGKAATAREAPSRNRAGRRIEIDRIVMMRVALVAIVVAFLYLIMRVAIIAFGGGGAREAARIERIVNETTVPGRPPPAAAGAAEPAKRAGASEQ